MTFIERMRSMNQEITKIRRKLMTELDRERYEHTLGVMYRHFWPGFCMTVQSVFPVSPRLNCVRNII